MKSIKTCQSFIVLCATMALTIIACEPGENAGNPEALQTLEDELYLSVGVIETPDLHPEEGFCLYTCESDRAVEALGACFAGTRCDRTECDGLANGIHHIACIDLPEAPEAFEPETQIELTAPDGRCAYLCEHGMAVEVAGGCYEGTTCERNACVDAPNGVNYGTCVEITSKPENQPEKADALKPKGEGACAYICDAGEVIESAGWCEENTGCDYRACQNANDGVIHARCISLKENQPEEEVEETENTNNSFEIAVGECGYRCYNGEVIDFRSVCLEGTSCSMDACEGETSGLITGECI